MTGARGEMWQLHIFEEKKQGTRPVTTGGAQ